MPRLVKQLWFQVLSAMVFGVLLAVIAPQIALQTKPLGDAFIALIRMMIAPVIFCTLVHGVAGMNDPARVGRVAGKALIYFLGMTLLALVFALVMVNLWRPGAGMNIDVASLDPKPIAAYAADAKHQTVVEFLQGIIPTTFASAFTQPNVLQVLLVSLLFAFALGLAGERGKPVRDLIGALSEVFFRMVGFIMWIAPFGAFGAIAFTVAKFGLKSLNSLGSLLAEFYLTSGLFVVVVLGAVGWLSGVSLIRLIVYLKEEIAIVAATTSTETVLPRLMQKLTQAGCDESVVGLVVPTGYAFNLDGTCLYLATAAVFLAQATNTPLDIAEQAGLIGVLLITSKGAAAVPGAAFVVLAATLGTLGTIPVAAIFLILGIHRLMAEALTFVNLVGNALAAIVVCKWEGALDHERMAQVLGRKVVA
jgi:aerobic C4-dicarboxylate transport protein